MLQIAMPRVPAAFGLVLLAAMLPFAVSADDAQRPGLVPDDYYQFQFISDPQISPDGGRVAFVRATVSEDRRSRESAIWLVSTDGEGASRRFTGETSDRNPRWSPDGRTIAFLSGRGERTQLYTIAVDGGEAETVTALEQGSIRAFEWLPDNRRVLLTLSLDPSVEDPTVKADEPEGPQPDMRRFTTAMYKSDADGFLDESRLTLWLLDSADGSLKRLAANADWNYHNAAVSPDGTAVAFNADRTGDEYMGGHHQDLYVLTLGDGDARRIDTPAGRAEAPVWSPDGRHLYYSHQAERYVPVTLQRVPVAGGSHEVVHDGMALTVTDVQFPARGQGPFFRADDRGARRLFTLADRGGPRAIAGDDATVNAASFSADGRRAAYLVEDEANLAEVWTARSDGSRARQLTRFNESFLASRDIGRYERFSFSNEAGGEVDGFVLFPVGLESGQRFPVVLNIKGGPHIMWGHQWFHEFQMLAAAGYGVIFTNYRGSTGYGHEFQSAVRLDYGGADFRDNMHLVDAALERFDWIDEDHLYVTGGSHGGFLTNWITTQTERFRAAVTQRSVSNWISEAGTQDYTPARMNDEFGGTIWTNFDYYWGRSPLKYADRVTSPTLVIHSDRDMITPIGQGQEWYFALIANGVETEMAMFEGETHDLSRGGTPVNLVKRLELILEWFGRYREEQ